MPQNVVITGANRGIGLSFCEHYKGLGFNVVGVCRTSNPNLEKIADNVIEGIDIGKKGSCEILFNELADVKVDVLINNAGILSSETLGQIDFEAISNQFQVNAIGALRVTEGLSANLTSNSKVAIITSRMGSIEDNDSGGYYGYRMSKAALNAGAKSLAIDLKNKSVAVGIFHPGYVTTDMTSGGGDISPDQSATRLASLIKNLNMSNTGTFWHSNGEILPW